MPIFSEHTSKVHEDSEVEGGLHFILEQTLADDVVLVNKERLVEKLWSALAWSLAHTILHIQILLV